MRISFDPWESGGVDGGRRNAWLSELKHLSCLRALQLQILRSGLPSEDVSFENLTRYDISIGYRPCQYGETKTSRRLKLYKIKGPDMVKCFSKLLKTTEVLALDRLGDTKHFVYELDHDGTSGSQEPGSSFFNQYVLLRKPNSQSQDLSLLVIFSHKIT
ncbi:hypothetical protein AAG906_013013 [Vitis piasezkii]